MTQEVRHNNADRAHPMYDGTCMRILGSSSFCHCKNHITITFQVLAMIMTEFTEHLLQTNMLNFGYSSIQGHTQACIFKAILSNVVRLLNCIHGLLLERVLHSVLHSAAFPILGNYRHVILWVAGK